MNLEILKNKKKKMGLSNAELSKISGVPLGTLSKVMAGIIKNPKLSTLQAITTALGCTLDDLYDEYLFLEETSKERPELQILAKYNQLNNKGKEKLQAYADDLLESPKYTTQINLDKTVFGHKTFSRAVAAPDVTTAVDKRKNKIRHT